MSWYDAAREILDNKSVSAIVGAGAAFLLVILNDWRRSRRKVGVIQREVAINLAHARRKLETVRRIRAMMREQNAITARDTIRFSSALLRELSAAVLDQLTDAQRMAIDALCFRMEATDEVLGDAHNLSRQLGHSWKADLTLRRYGEAIGNLKILIEMCELYLAKDYALILNKRFYDTDYAEP